MARWVYELRGPIIEGIVWVVFAGVAYGLTYQFDEPLLQYRYGAAGWPRVIIVALGLFALIQMIWNLFQSRGKRITGRIGEEISDAPPEAIGTLVHLKRLGTFGVPLVYLVLMPRMGFYILTPFFLAGYMMLLGERRLVHLVGTTLLIFALTLLIFTKLLFVPLPIGNWPGCYDINSLLVSLIK